MRVTLPDTLSPSTMIDLERDLEDARHALVVIVEGCCRGMDLDVFAASKDPLADLRRFAQLIAMLRTIEAPTIARVHGPMIGGGLGILAACDVVIATREATFALPEALFGLLPGVVVPVLLERMSPHAVRLLALLGVAKSAAWAEREGLVDEITDDLDRSCGAWERALARADKKRIPELREWTSCARTLSPMEALERGAERTARAGAEPRVKKGVRAFVEEGIAPWQR